jgi:phosphodiesterase/alkaline phosphatase D-like protein
MDQQLTQPGQQALYSGAPIAYLWDDHDYGGDNANGQSPARPAAAASYRYTVPHYGLPDDDGAIYQAFTVGRVRFILTDTRSQRSLQTDPDGPAKTMLGEDQKEWFKQQLLDTVGKYPLIVWVNPDPWIAEAAPLADNWGGYATERREIADFVAENDIRGLAMLSGDAHMLAIDDGTNSDYSTDQSGGFPVFHAAPLDKQTSLKGGPYSEGTSLQSGQFGLMTVTDNGSTIEVAWSGRTWHDEEVLQYEFSVPAG